MASCQKLQKYPNIREVQPEPKQHKSRSMCASTNEMDRDMCAMHCTTLPSKYISNWIYPIRAYKYSCETFCALILVSTRYNEI